MPRWRPVPYGRGDFSYIKIAKHKVQENWTVVRNTTKTTVRWNHTVAGQIVPSQIGLMLYTQMYTVWQKLSTTWLVSIISFLIMNLFQIGLLFSLPVHTYLLTRETGYWSIFIYVYMTGCVRCHVYFSTLKAYSSSNWFFLFILKVANIRCFILIKCSEQEARFKKYAIMS